MDVVALARPMQTSRQSALQNPFRALCGPDGAPIGSGTDASRWPNWAELAFAVSEQAEREGPWRVCLAKFETSTCVAASNGLGIAGPIAWADVNLQNSFRLP